MPDLSRLSFPRLAKLTLFAIVVQLLTGCAPEVGSDEWCDAIKKKSSGDMTMNEAKDYARHCILK
jgi:hypothetical protein